MKSHHGAQSPAILLFQTDGELEVRLGEQLTRRTSQLPILDSSLNTPSYHLIKLGVF